MEQNINAVWVRLQNDKNHSKKLEAIKKRSERYFSSPPDASKYRKHLHLRSIVHEKARVKNIIQENRRFLIRLSNISCDLATPDKSKAKGKSLNSKSRKIESERIRQANNTLAGRIENQTSLFSLKRLEKDFEKAEKYRKLHSKFNCLKSITRLGRKNMYAISNLEKRGQTVSDLA